MEPGVGWEDDAGWMDGLELHGVGEILQTEYKMSTSSFSKPWGRGLLLRAELFLKLSCISQMSE